MNAKLVNMIKAFNLLTDAEKEEFIKTIKKIETGSVLEKRAVMESLSAVNFSPAPGRCSLCGK